MRAVLLLSATIGGLLGGYVPVLFGADPLGSMSILAGTLGTCLGIWAGYVIYKNYL